jgi:hypothetical protein
MGNLVSSVSQNVLASINNISGNGDPMSEIYEQNNQRRMTADQLFNADITRQSSAGGKTRRYTSHQVAQKNSPVWLISSQPVCVVHLTATIQCFLYKRKTVLYFCEL